MKFVKHFVHTQTLDRAGLVKAKTRSHFKRIERKQQRAALRAELHRALVEERLEEIRCSAEAAAAAHLALVERTLRKARTSSKRHVRSQKASTRKSDAHSFDRHSFEVTVCTRVLYGPLVGQERRVVARANCAVAGSGRGA